MGKPLLYTALTGDILSNRIHRILVYSHNSIGLGHTFRVLAIITGIKKWRPDIDFLVVSGTSVPHILLRQGIEVIKLPGLKKLMTGESNCLVPRYLHETNLDGILEYRRKTVADVFDFFKPDVLMIEHYLAGLSGEVNSLLARKKACVGTLDEFPLVNLSRGIMGGVAGVQGGGYVLPMADSLSLYDFIYIFDDRTNVDVNREFLGNDPLIESRIRYMGRITGKHFNELPDPREVLKRFRLSEEPIILMNLSRHGNIGALSRGLMSAFHRTGLNRLFQIIMVIDPYLEQGVFEDLQKDPLFENVRFLPFFYPLVDIIHVSKLVICRAGYNIINEILLTDAKALIIPEHHPGGEQERRTGLIPRNNVVVMAEEDILTSLLDHILLELLNREKVPLHFRFDKYQIGKDMIADLENWSGMRQI
jgi:predicted glycosyltransferase